LLQYPQRPGTLAGKEVEINVIKPIQKPNLQTDLEETWNLSAAHSPSTVYILHDWKMESIEEI
jgi:hypothetical protein